MPSDELKESIRIPQYDCEFQRIIKDSQLFVRMHANSFAQASRWFEPFRSNSCQHYARDSIERAMSKSVALVAAFAVALRAHSKAQTRKALKALLAAIGTYGLVRILSSFSRACIGLPRERSPCEIWAAKREEDAVEPELRVFDPHHHFFDF